MSDLLPTLDVACADKHPPSNQSTPTGAAAVTARLYTDSENRVVYLPKVLSKSINKKPKVSTKSPAKERCKERKPGAGEVVATEDFICLSDSDSDSYSSYDSYSSADSLNPGVYLDSEKTRADLIRRYSGCTDNATRSSSQESVSDSPTVCASVSLPSFLPFASTGDSRSVKSMRKQVASSLSRHNHHILLHRGQNALNSHIQITVNSKAANEIAAHAVITEVPALLPIHRQRAHLAALTEQRHPLGMPPVSPKTLSLTLPGANANATSRRLAASPSYHNSTGLKSPPLSPRGTTLLSPLHITPAHTPHGTKEKKTGEASSSTPCHRIPSNLSANPSVSTNAP